MKFILSVMTILLFSAATIPLPSSGGPNVLRSGTYANSQVDTVFYARPATLSGGAFMATWADSVSVTTIIMRRVVDGVVQAVVAGDTLFTSFAGTSTTQKIATFTLTPMPGQYAFIVTYASSANGFTSPTVKYGVNQQFYSH